METLALKLTTSARPVIIEDAQDVKTEWELREMKAADRDTYLNQWVKRFHSNDKGEPTYVQDFNGLQAALLTRTLFRKDDGKPVDEKTVQSWPCGAVTELFKAARDLNKLDPEEGDAEKNGSPVKS